MESDKRAATTEERPSLRDLFPRLTEEQLRAVEDTFYGYLDILWWIYSRLKRERPQLFDSFGSPSYHEEKVESQ